MNKERITSADEYARQAEEHEADGMEWSTTVQVDPSVLHEVLDRYPRLSSLIVNHEQLPGDVLGRLSRWPEHAIRYELWKRDQLPDGVVESLLRDIHPDVRQGAGKWYGITPDQLAEAHPGCPSWPVTDVVARSLKERFGVCWREVVSRSLPRHLKPYDDPKVVVALLASEGYPDLDPLHLEGNEDNWAAAIARSREVANWVSYSGQTPVLVLRQLATHEHRRCREAVAVSPDAPPEVLAALSLDSSLIVRHKVAENARTDLATLLLLASDDIWMVRRMARLALEQRYGVLLHPQKVVTAPRSKLLEPIATITEFLALCRSANPAERVRVRFGKLEREVWLSALGLGELPHIVARNQTVPVEVILKIDRDYVAAQRDQHQWPIYHVFDLALLGRPEVAEALARHPEPRFRSVAAGSLNSPISTLEFLATEPGEGIAEWAHQTLQLLSGRRQLGFPCLGRFKSPDEIMSAITNSNPAKRRNFSRTFAPNGMWRDVLAQAPELAKWVAINETVGPRLLDELAEWPDPEIRKWVSDNPRAWLKTLTRLAFDADPSVRRRAVYNSRLSSQTLARLQGDRDPEVAAEAARRLAARAYVDRLLNDPEWWRHLGNSEIV